MFALRIESRIADSSSHPLDIRVTDYITFRDHVREDVRSIIAASLAHY